MEFAIWPKEMPAIPDVSEHLTNFLLTIIDYLSFAREDLAQGICRDVGLDLAFVRDGDFPPLLRDDNHDRIRF